MKSQHGGTDGGKRICLRGRPIGLILLGLLFLPAAAQGADTWNGAGADDNWSTLSNWMDGSPPLAADSVTFNATDSGGTNVVDADFTIWGLVYKGNGTHTTSLLGGHLLQVKGDPVSSAVIVGSGGSGDGATVAWTGHGSVTVGEPASPLGFYVGFNGTATATNVSSLTIDGPDVDALVGKFEIGSNYSTGAADGEVVLGNNGKLTVGPSAAANMKIGYNNGLNGSATGLLDASHGDANLDLFQLNVGYNNGSEGSATGTLRWDQPNPLHADYVYFSRGSNATGILDVPAGGTFLLGTAADPVLGLYPAYNEGTGSTSANLDFSVNDPTAEIHLSNGFAMGLNRSTGNTDGSVVLGNNSKLYVGTPSNLADVTIGYNHGLGGTATGLLDTSKGVAEMHIDELLVGDNKSGSDPAALGTATGTLTTGNDTIITADKVRIGRGPGATGTVNLKGGLFAANILSMGPDSKFNFTGGRLAVYAFNTPGGTGYLEQHGGTLAPGFSHTQTSLAGVSTISGNYLLDTGGVLEIELFGTDPAAYDQLRVYGMVDLDADLQGGGTLDVRLNFGPLIDDQFVIVDNDSFDAISGRFLGLSDLATFDETYLDSLYRFQISYFGGTGNDVMLKVLEKIDHIVIPAPGAVVLVGIGAGCLSWLRRRRTI